jgi:hypothetical protein
MTVFMYHIGALCLLKLLSVEAGYQLAVLCMSAEKVAWEGVEWHGKGVEWPSRFKLGTSTQAPQCRYINVGPLTQVHWQGNGKACCITMSFTV